MSRNPTPFPQTLLPKYSSPPLPRSLILDPNPLSLPCFPSIPLSFPPQTHILAASCYDMSSDNFRLESFRPWDPHEKLHPLQKRPDPCRYPSPVSLDATPPAAPSKGPTRDFQALRSGRHPLPVRPPVEVCVDGGLQSVTKVSRQPEMAEQFLPVSGDSACFDFEDISPLQNVTDSENIQDTPSDPVNAESEPRANTASDGLKPSFTPDRDYLSDAFEARTPTSMEAFPKDFTIDPAILGESRSQSKDQDFAEPVPDCTTHRARSPIGDCPLSKDDGRPRGKRRRSTGPGRPSSKVNKVSVVIDNRRKENPKRLSRETNTTKASFSTIQAHFSAAVAEDRLQFLSWLFEGALSRCFPPNIAASSTETTESSSRMENTPSALCFSRKGLLWSAEEDRLLLELKEEENLTGAEVIRRFDQIFPGRSPGSIQVHWSTKLSKRRSSLAKNT